jgi:hypothetical protein
MSLAAAARAPREIIEDPVDVGRLLEGAEPPLALAANEVEFVVGKPPADLETGEGMIDGFAGLRYFRREHSLTYRRDDGTTLHYVYEGALAYSLAWIEEDAASA